MKKLIFGILCTLGVANAANNNTLDAVKAYQKLNIVKLEKLHNNDANPIISFYLAELYLEKNKLNSAIKITESMPDNTYIKLSLQHNILNYYFNNNSWSNYIEYYHKLPTDQINNNELCGFDLAMMSTESSYTPTSKIRYYANNKTPTWCTDTIYAAEKAKFISIDTVNSMLYGMIINGEISTFNANAKKYGIAKQNFKITKKNPAKTPYQIVYMISKDAYKDPAATYTLLKKLSHNLDPMTIQYLNNYMMVRLASKQKFDLALDALQDSNVNYFSDEMFEWRNRVFIYYGQWQNLIDAIEASPKNLQEKNSWIYWKAYAYSKLNENYKARSIIKDMNQNYTYYSLLGYSQYFESVKFPAPLKTTESISDLKLSQSVSIALDAYAIANKYKSKPLKALATNEWMFAAKKSDDSDLVLMANLAKNINWYDMSVYAGSQIDQVSMELSYPLFFSEYYKKYSELYGIEASYPLAITRQESRFNPTVVAFDGGVGLMQIMPKTARFIARSSKSKNCYKDFTCNIKFGSWYLSSLTKKFGNNLIYSTAAYNAGPKRVHNWQTSFASLDVPTQIELMPFAITRHYVQQVMTNKAVYDSQLNGNNTINMAKYLNQFDGSKIIFLEDGEDTDSDKK